MTDENLERLIAALQADPSITDWIGAGAAVITMLIAAGALWFASAQIKEAKTARDIAQQEAKAARELSQQLEVERAQPYVVVFTEPSPASNLAVDLVLKNFGATAAHDVRLSLEPWPQRSEPGAEAADVGIPEFPILAPEQEWRTSWVWQPHREGSGLPDRHVGEVRYRGLNDSELSSPVVLDLSIYSARRWVVVRTTHDVADALRDIKSTVEKWTDGLHGLAVYTRSGDARDDRMRADYERWQREEAEREPRAAVAGDEVR